MNNELEILKAFTLADTAVCFVVCIRQILYEITLNGLCVCERLVRHENQER